MLTGAIVNGATHVSYNGYQICEISPDNHLTGSISNYMYVNYHEGCFPSLRLILWRQDKNLPEITITGTGDSINLKFHNRQTGKKWEKSYADICGKSINQKFYKIHDFKQIETRETSTDPKLLIRVGEIGVVITSTKIVYQMNGLFHSWKRNGLWVKKEYTGEGIYTKVVLNSKSRGVFNTTVDYRRGERYGISPVNVHNQPVPPRDH
jgi:hypothetical protein